MVSLDQNVSWENVETVRISFLKNYKGSGCRYLLPNENIKENIELFMKRVNTSSENHIQKNLTRNIINRGAKMFLYLNSCPQTTSNKNFYREFFSDVFKKCLFEPTNSGIILYTLNAMKLFPNDGRVIASKIFEKISTLFELSSIQSQKNDSTVEATHHPAHILNRKGNFSPSSFIPFCAFGNDKNFMGRGREVDGFNDLVCNSFKAKILNDQLCYEIDLEKYKNQKNIKEQLMSGLVLFLDYNLERQSKMYNPQEYKKHSDENDVHIYLDTISKLNF